MIKHKMQIETLLVLIFLAIISADGSNCSDIRIEMEHDSLNVIAWLDRGDEVNGDLRITSKGSNLNISEYDIFPGDLIMDGGMARLSRNNVKILGKQDLKRDIPLDIQVNVSGLTEPGTYRGNLTLLYFCEGHSNYESINLTVLAKRAPALTPATSKLSLQLVNTGNDRFDIQSIIAHMLLAKSSFQSQVGLKINNTNQVPVTLKSASLLIEGDTPGNQFADTALKLDAPATYSAMPIISIPLNIDREKMPSDHYTGRITLLFEGQKNPVSIPVDVKVRSGPFWVVLFLLIGIIFGKLYQHYQDSGKYQADALKEILHLRSMIMSPLLDPDDKLKYQRKLDQMENMIYQENWDKAKLDEYLPRIKAIKDQIQLLEELISIKATVEGKNKIKDMIYKGQIDSARIEIENLQNEKPESDSSSLESLDLAKFNGTIERAKALWNLHAGFIFYLGLLFFLLCVGLLTLYVNEGSTFGANPFSDYVKVFTWGLASEVTSRTIPKIFGN